MNIDLADPTSIVVLLAILSLAPFVLVMVTSFVKIAVVLSILRNAIGTPQIPPAIVINGLAVILTIYVMQPTGHAIYQVVQPKLATSKTGALSGILDIAGDAKEPLRTFMLKHSRSRDRAMFVKLAKRMAPKEIEGRVTGEDFLVVMPAFAIGQLTSAFQVGFLIFVPFLVIDMVVANILLALGMHMLSPTTVSLPFKLLLFVLVDGWQLIAHGLVSSYA